MKQLGTTWSTSTRARFAFAGLSVGLLLLTVIPYLFGYWSSPPDRRFMGILINVPDTAQYFSWARESAQAVLIDNKLTPEVGTPVYFNLFWFVVGRLGIVLGPESARELARIVAGLAYLTAIYVLARLFLATPLQRWIGVLVAVLGGGFGWLLVVHKYLTRSPEVAFPLALNVYESNTFVSVLAFPHQSMAMALLLASVGLTVVAFEANRLTPALVAGLLALLLGLQHGYDLLTVYAVAGCTGLVLAARYRGWQRARPVLVAAIICAPSVPAALYLAYITRQSPIWRGVLAQYGNAGIYTPDPLGLLVVLGLPALVVLFALPVYLRVGSRRGFLKVILGSRPRDVILWSWVFAGCALVYVPTDFQIKLLGGWHVPLAFLASRSVVAGSAALLTRLRKSDIRVRPALIGALFVLAVVPTNVYFYAWRLVDLDRHTYPYYLRADDLRAMQWLEANSDPSDVVLSSVTIGQYIPSVSGNKAFLAHWAQTLEYFQKRALVSAFFNPATTESARLVTLATYGVGWVFWSQSERDLGGFDPAAEPYLDEVFATPDARVFRVNRAAIESVSATTNH
jgi:hypothetical protein